MNYNPCIFTGCTAWIEEYPAAVHGDLFLVGDTLILTGWDEFIHQPGERGITPVDCQLFFCAEHSLIKEPQKFIAVPFHKVVFSDEGKEKIQFNLSVDGIEIEL